MSDLYDQRRAAGKVQIMTRTAMWGWFWSVLAVWHLWGWFSDDYKDLLSFGFWEPSAKHMDTNVSSYRNARVALLLRPYD